MSAKSKYRDAIIDDGRQVLYEVTRRLYKGGYKRPDIYFQRDPQLRNKNYNKIFGPFERQTIASSGLAEFYDIRQGARHFDITIQADLIKHACGLNIFDPLLRKVDLVRSYRNAVCHPSDPTDVWELQSSCEIDVAVTDENLNEKLFELLELYEGILEDLEEKTGDRLAGVKQHVRSVISERMISKIGTYARSSHSCSSTPYVNRTRSSSSSESSEIPTWGKVALGLTAGIAALAMGAAAAANADESESERRRRIEARRNQTRNNSNQEECSVM